MLEVRGKASLRISVATHGEGRGLNTCVRLAYSSGSLRFDADVINSLNAREVTL